MIVVNEAGLIGDSLAFFPAMQYLARQSSGPAYAYIGNPLVRELMPESVGFLSFASMSDGVSTGVVSKSCATAAWQYGISTLHMIQAHFGVLGLPVPDEVPKAEIVVDAGAPEYDFVVAPWSRSDCQHNKAWFEDRWLGVLAELSGRVAIVGSSEDPKPWGVFHPRFKGCVEYVYGKSLRYVAGMMRKARRAVLTIDNGISHLAFHVGAKNHVLLYPQCLPPKWVANPDAAVTIRREPREITVDEVLGAVKKAALLAV